MMLADAISSATSEHAVYFLVAAYVESLHHFHRSLGIPERVIALPLAGLDDLEERLRLLGDGLGSTRQPPPPPHAPAARGEAPANTGRPAAHQDHRTTRRAGGKAKTNPPGPAARGVGGGGTRPPAPRPLRRGGLCSAAPAGSAGGEIE